MTLDDLASTVLGTAADRTGFDDRSFIELGGDSLGAMRFAALARERLGVQVPLRALLGGGTLAAAIAASEVVDEPAADGPEPPAPVLDGLSHVQRGMWLIESVTGGSPYNLVFTARVERGGLDPALFTEAVRRTVARHEGLRTVFAESDDGLARVVLDDHVPEVQPVPVDGPATEFADRVRALAAEHGRRPFDLTAAPAVRFLLLTHPSGGQAAVLAAHHMVLDGTAVGLVLRELFTWYDELEAGTPAGRAPGAGLAALIRSQERQRADGGWDRQAAYWTDRLRGVPTVLELPADRARPQVQDAAGARAPLDLGPVLTGAATERARELGVTTFALLLGAFGLALSRTTGARALLVGVPLVGRGTSELAGLVGVAGNLVPVRIDVDDDLTAAAYLRSVQDSLTATIDAGDLPFEELVARLGAERTIGCHPLVQVCFGMHDQLVPQELSTRSVRAVVEENHGGGSQFDLTLLVGRYEPALAGHVEYATAVWGRSEVDGFVDDFTAAVGELAAGGDPALADVRCLSPARLAALDAVNDVRTAFPHTSVDALFRGVVDRFPDVVAVREDDVQLSYAQLAGLVARQARLLREAGVRPGDRVLIGVERSVAEAVAVLGTLSAGASYVGVDPALPAAHVALIVDRAAPAALLTSGDTPDALRRVPRVAGWDRSWTWEPQADPPPADPDREAYVAFTSGSTGEPKGVRVPHRAVIRLVHEPDYVRTGPGERMLRLAPLAFDASTLELFGALLTGAALEVYPARSLPSPSDLGAFLPDRGITVAWLTAGLFRLVEEFAPDALGGLRQLLTGGDVVPHDHAARALARHPGLVLTNGYGPTENTTFTTTHTVTRPQDVHGPLPIGTPVPGTRVYVLDERGHRVPPGAVGELYTGGEGLAGGYVGDPEETARRFGRFCPGLPERLYRTGDLVRLDTRGRLTFLGRSDDQVKLRGYRIELAPIGDALRAQPGVADAVVVVTGVDSAQKRLVAAVVPEPGATVSTGDLRDALAGLLPGYMVPTLWTVVDAVPLTANGKVDRAALAAGAGAAGAVTAAPADPGARSGTDDLELIRRLFGEAREGPAEESEVDPDTDFFTDGGTSFGAVQLIRMLKSEFAVTLRLRDFLLAPTPEGVLRLVEKAGRR